MRWFLFALAIGLMTVELSAAQGQSVKIPDGNRNIVQPDIPKGSLSRTKSSHGTFQGKYEKIRDLIASDRKLAKKIKKSAQKFGIEPIHIVGALVGEHTYNVDALDYLQTYLVKAASYLKSGIDFSYDGEAVEAFVSRPQFTSCAQFSDSYRLWSCREKIWRQKFAGKNVDGKTWPKDRFGKVFFQPLYAGQTFGLGQLNPITALQVNDMVRKVTGRKKLHARNAPKVYEAIMDPDSSLDYMAAVLRQSIDAYKDVAGLDISGNPGITATLYNLGDVITRAETMKHKRLLNSDVLPEENYYGWLVNEKLGELELLVQ